MSTTTTPAGWYRDPLAGGQLRYFDGTQWTEHVAAGTATLAPPVSSDLGEHPDDLLHWVVPTGRAWQTIVAGYLGLFTMFIWPLGPVCLGFGWWALVSASRTGSHGRGRAWFAVVVGALATFMMVAIVVNSGN